MSDIFVGDIGTSLQVTVTEDGSPVDISTAGAIQMKLRAPDGKVLTKTASIVNVGDDGLVEYVTQDGDLDQPGRWRIQLKVLNLGGWTGHTSEGDPFDVKQVVG